MRIQAPIAALGALLLSGAMALANPMDVFIGNTLLVGASPDAQMSVYPNADGTYTGTLPDGSAIGGNWTVEGATVCFIRTSPNAQAPICNDMADAAVGDTWTASGLDGAELTLTLVQGR